MPAGGSRPRRGSRRHAPPEPLIRLVGRYDPDVLRLGPRPQRLRLRVRPDAPAAGRGDATAGPVDDDHHWDVELSRTGALLLPAASRLPDSGLSARLHIWTAVADDPPAAGRLFLDGTLRGHGSAHLALGFLAATSGDRRPGRLTWSSVRTPVGRVSLLEAGVGRPLVCIHGLGGTKISMLPLVRGLAPGRRVIALDLPGFGESVKPLRNRYDAREFATAVLGVLDALGLGTVDLLGHSLGGRIALEVALRDPRRVRRLVLLTPAMAWLRRPAWHWLVRLAPSRLGALQPTPRRLTSRVLRGVLAQNGADVTDPAVRLAVNEFLRGYATPGGRVAFYSAARNIALDDPLGAEGLWTRLSGLAPASLFVWGRRDPLVPAAFGRHVRERLPQAAQLELDCGHLPQVERPRELVAGIRTHLDKP
jgi:pimeloyl-ACP methyl ester carboxylesterase